MTNRRALARIAVMTGLLAAGREGSPALQVNAEVPRWIAGCWSGTRGTERFSERWVVADPGTMIGVAHTLEGGSLSAFEFLRIVARGPALVYIAQPGGAPPTEFTAPPADRSASAITFGNPAHDFPKRVGYRRVDATHLTAWVDGGPSTPLGTGPSSGSAIEYAMTRTACEP
jgi:hypothetical protein